MKHKLKDLIGRKLNRVLSLLLVCCMISGHAFGQLATYPLVSTGGFNFNPNPALGNANVTAGTFLPGSEIENANPNGTAWRIKNRKNDPSKLWPTSVTNNYHFDVPVSPKAGYDMNITSLSFIVRQVENGPIDLMVAPMFQVNGSGPWYPLSTPYNLKLSTGTVSVPVNFPVNEAFFSGKNYVIRFYVYGGASSDDDDESFRISTLLVNGTVTAPPAVKPAVTTESATKDPIKPKYEGNVTGTYNAGGGYYLAKEKGIVWSTSSSPTLASPTRAKDVTSPAGTINIKMTGLSAGTNYCARAYIITQADTIYGADKCFTTDPQSVPVVTTNAIPAGNIYSNKVIAGGAVADSGGLAIIEKGIVWNTGGGATTSSNLGKWIMGSGTSSFFDFIKGLKPSADYCVRAYAVNALGTSYGTDVCFTTGAPVPVLSAIPGTLDMGENIYGGFPITLSYTFTGSNLTPGPGTINIQIPAGFSMGTSANGTFTKGPASLSVSYNGTSFSKPIFVQLPTNIYGSFTGTITCTGAGVAAGDADIVNVKGSIIQSPDDISNKGTDFWTGFAYQEKMSQKAGNSSEAKMSIYISNSGTTPVTAKVELPGIPGAAGFPVNVTIAPNSVYEVQNFPTGDPSNAMNPGNMPDTRLYFTGVTNRGIHITSSAPVSVWMHTYTTGNSAAAAMLFPTNTWQSAYTVLSYGGTSNNSNPNAFFFVIAKDDNTVIEFTPANPILANVASAIFTENHNASQILYQKGQTYQLTLNRGQVFNAMGYTSGPAGLDLTGTTVKTICDPLNPMAEEKKIAVFGGNGRVLVLTKGCNTSSGSDHLVQQMFPSVALGTEYLSAPTKTMEWNLFRIMPKDMAAKVYVNGVQLTAANIPAGANFYEYESNQPLRFTSDLPMSVTQFIVAGGCANAKGSKGQGDPEMIILSPVQQAITNTTVFSSYIKKDPSGSGKTNASYINVIIKQEGIASFKFDGKNTADTGVNTFTAPNIFAASGIQITMAQAFQPHPAAPGYYRASFWVTCGTYHSISSDFPFNAIAYGMGDGESYGYNAGTSLKNLSSIKIAENPYGKDTSTSVIRTCKENPVTLRIALPYNASLVDSIIWDPGFDPRITPLGAVKGAMNGAIAKSDGIITQDGRDFNLYTAPSSYKFANLGSYQFTVIAYGKFTSDCGNKEVQKILVVVGKDNIAFDYTSPGCGSTVITFQDKTEPMAGTTIKSWSWDFGDAKTSAVQNPPAHTYAATPPTYWVKLSTINSIGCISVDSALVDFSGGMKGEFFANADTICPGSSIVFAGAENSTSDGSSGTITEWQWDFGDGKTYVGNSLANANPPAHVYSDAGTYTVKMILKSSLGCTSLPVDTVITVKPLPLANFDLPGGVCIPGTTLFTNTSTIADNSIGMVKYLWNFDDALNSNIGNPNTSTATNGTHIYTSAPPTTPGYYSVKLTATSAFGCTKDTVKQLKNVFSPPTASFILPAGGEVCLNSDSTFRSNSSATGGQIFSNYTWDFGDGTAVQSGAGFNVIKHLFGLPGAYQVKLTVTTNQGCVDDTIQTITVATPPIADFTWSANTCVNNAVQFNDASTPAGSIKGWSWTFGDASSSATQSPAHTYTASGSVNVGLQVFTAAGCASEIKTRSLSVNPSPVVDFTLPAGLCVPGTTNFPNKTTISGAPTSINYVWDYDDNGATSNGFNGSHVYTAGKAGGFNISLTATSASGCVGQATKNLLDVFEPPVANFTISNAALCQNQAVQFTDASQVTGSQVINKWDWNFGDGKTGNAATENHLYAATGSFKATLTVTSNKGCISTVSAPQFVIIHPNPSVVFTTKPGICFEAVARPLNTTTAATETTGLAGSFTYSGTGVQTTGGGFEFNPAASGAANINGYSIKAVYETSNGCKDSASSLMKVFPTPQARWTNSSPVCEKNSVSLTDASVAGFGKITTWQWDMGDGTNSSLNSPKHVYTAAGNYNISLQVKTDSGCLSTLTTQPLTVNNLPVVAVGLPGALCLPNAQGQFKDQSSIADGTASGFTYKWEFGDGGISTAKDPGHTYANASGAPYKLQLTVTSSQGCIDSLPQRLTLTNLYPPPVPDFTLVPGEICLGDSMLFSDHSNGVTSNIVKWSWSFGDGQSDSLRNNWHRYANANSFDVKLTVTNGEGCTASTSKKVKVNAYPKIIMADEVWVKQGASIALRPSVTDISNSVITYKWTPTTYLSGNNIKDPVSTPQKDQMYILTVTAGTGCSTSDSITVSLLRDLKPPNAFSPNGDNINDVWNIPYLQNYAGAVVQIFDRYGKPAWKSVGYNKPWDGTFNGKPLPTGVYYYIINPKNGFEPFTGSVTLIR